MTNIHGVDVLEIKFELNGAPRTIYPTLIRGSDSPILVDTGFQGQLPLFRRAIEATGLAIKKLGTIIVTHQDRDHIGGLPELVELIGPKVGVISHEFEKPYIQGELIFEKKAPPGQTDTKPSTEQRTGVKVTRTLRDGDRLPELGGIIAIHTPGHTLGHLCLYLEREKLLIAGDTLNVVDGSLTGPNLLHTHDLRTAYQSLGTLSRFDIRAVISYHCGYLEGDINRRITDLIQASRI